MNDTEIGAQIRAYLKQDETELVMEIARSVQRDIQLHSPEAWIAKGEEIIRDAWPRVRELVCAKRDLLDKPEFELAAGICDLIAIQFGIPLATLLAVYVVKRGIIQLCGRI